MARWTVTEGQQRVDVESIEPGGLVSLDIPTGGPFIATADTIRDLRTKLGLAIGEDRTGNNPSAQDAGLRHSQGGESNA